MIRAVLFDLWGTLILDDPQSSAARRDLRASGAQSALDEMGITYPIADVITAFDAAGSALERVHATERDLSARGRTILYLRHLDADLPDRLDDDGWCALDTAILMPALEHRPMIMPDAAETLDAVKRLGLTVGLVSNAGATPGFVLRELLGHFDLLPFFDDLVFSDEVELSKPAPAIFAHALEQLGLESADAAFVGDQPILDVLGARRAGLWSIQIGDLPPDGAEPHGRIDTLSGLLPTLRDLKLVG